MKTFQVIENYDLPSKPFTAWSDSHLVSYYLLVYSFLETNRDLSEQPYLFFTDVNSNFYEKMMVKNISEYM